MLKNGLPALCVLHEYMDLNQTFTDISFGHAKELIRVTVGQRMLKNCLSAIYLLNRRMNFKQTCTDVSLRGGKN